MWYFNVLIELFQVKSAYLSNILNPQITVEDTELKKNFLGNFLLPHKIFNLLIHVFSLSGLLIFKFCFFLFRSPSWPCGSSCRGGVTRKDAWWLNILSPCGYYFRCIRLYPILNLNFKQEILAKCINSSKKSILEQKCYLPNRVSDVR